MSNPPKKFFRLTPGREVRLRYAFFVTCTNVIKNDVGDVVELRCTYDPDTRGGKAPDGRKVKATLHWVSADHAMDGEVRLYDQLFTAEDPGKEQDILEDLNPQSLEVIQNCKLEPSLKNAAVGQTVQFERLGYFCVDKVSSAEKPVFNRTMMLRDSWAKVQNKS